MLYHFTDSLRLGFIMEDGYLKLTPSSLLKPVSIHVERDERGILSYVDETDSYKPVVWLTSIENAKGGDLGIHNLKCTIRIALEEKPEYRYYPVWARENKMKTNWFKSFTRDKRFGSWYVCEKTIPVSDFIEIVDMRTGEVLYRKCENNVA